MIEPWVFILLAVAGLCAVVFTHDASAVVACFTILLLLGVGAAWEKRRRDDRAATEERLRWEAERRQREREARGAGQ